MRLRTFGALELTSDGELTPDHRIQRRQLAIFAVLATSGSAGVTREQLRALFWSDADSERARHALDQALYLARRLAGADVVVERATSLVLDAHVLASDVNDLAHAIERGAFGEAVGLYAGPFLNGVGLADAPEFERWVDGRRAYFANAFVQCLTRLARDASSAGDYSMAVTYLRRAATSDPLSGTVAHALMLALAYAGDRSGALDAARVHEALVRDELETDPDPVVSQLRDDLRAGKVRAPATPRAVPAPAVAPAISNEFTSPTAPRSGGSPAAPDRSRTRFIALSAAGMAILIILAFAINRSIGSSEREHRVLLQDRTQVTFAGRTSTPALSSSGKQLAYVTSTCGVTDCRYAIELQNVGQTTTRRLVQGATAIQYLHWSPDGRNLVAVVFYPDHAGTYLISALDGTSRRFTDWVEFFAGGDSLLLTLPPARDSAFWIYVADLNGVPHDSIRVTDPGDATREVHVVPGTSWIAVVVKHGEEIRFRIIDRNGRVADDRTMHELWEIRASHDALWLQFGQGANGVLSRISIDSASGRLSARMDTIFTGTTAGYSVTPDGGTLVLEEGTTEFDLWAVGFQDALRGAFAPDTRLLHSSSLIATAISPEGSRLLVARDLGASMTVAMRLSVIPFHGGTERTLRLRGAPLFGRFLDAGFTDSVTVAVASHVSGRVRLYLVDVRTDSDHDELEVPDSSVQSFAAMPGGGWAWITPDGQHIRVQRGGETAPRTFPKPEWYIGLNRLSPSLDGRSLLVWGTNVHDDSARITSLTLATGASVPWATVMSAGGALWLTDGSICLSVEGTADTRTFYRLRSPGRMELLGTIPRPLVIARVSRDLQRVAVITSDRRGDAWMYHVRRP